MSANLISWLCWADMQPRMARERLQDFQARLHFESLVADIASTFVNLGLDEIDKAIVEALQRIAEALDLDRGTLFQLVEEDDMELTHYWTRSGVPLPQVRRNKARDQFPWSLAKILSGQVACFSDPNEIEDAKEREIVRMYDTKSRVAVPLSIEGRIAGCIAFASTGQESSWPEDIIGHFRLIAQLFANVLSRKRAEASLRASEERFRSLADNAPIMIWISGPDKMSTWFNKQWLTFVGHSLESALDNGWTEALYPQDLDRCVNTYRTAFDARVPFAIEYRLRHHTGVWKWILGRGTPQYDTGKEFTGYICSCTDITEEKQAQERLQTALSEVKSLRDQLQAENTYLRREVHERRGGGPVVGRSPAIQKVLDQIEHVARTDSTVLLLGETGTGKELFATQIHEQSARRERTMVRVNCAALPATLIESELFGRERGAFTGALARQIGRFELADHSTIFLDEIGDLPLEVQVKLLRVLEERQIERLGSAKGIRVDTRIIAATHRDLEKRVAEGTFRADLFYRLNVFPIQVPPLRNRVEDIPLLVWKFVAQFSEAFGKRIESIARENMISLQQYSWPGNIRELRNVVERAMISATGSRLTIAVPTPSQSAPKQSVNLKDVEREHFRSVLESTGWRIRGSSGAADLLGLKPTTLETRMAKLGLHRPKPS